MVMQLDRPFQAPPGVDPHVFVTQMFGINNPGIEPFGYKYGDSSIWYDGAPGVQPGNWHNGVDYGLGHGVPLFAPAEGTVVFAAFGAPNTQPIDTRGFGNCLVIRHTLLGVYTLYGHLSSIGVSPNERVQRGNPIARVGSTGNSTGPHLHWAVIRMVDSHYVDPQRFLDTAMGEAIKTANFTVTADADGDPVRVFAGPSRQFTALRVVQPGSVLQCTAWTYGEPRLDRSTGRPDARWYRLADGGWLASARVQGNAPNSTALP
jgi:murein DD-endopeptidase MepM/ murein hydrolase activator NlpD